MRKILAMSMLAFCLVSMTPQKAHAQETLGAVLAGAPYGEMAAFFAPVVVATILLPYLDQTGLKPFEDGFKVVDYSYPGDPVGFHRYVMEDGVDVGPDAVRHPAVVHNDQRYKYQDATGVHPPKKVQNDTF